VRFVCRGLSGGLLRTEVKSSMGRCRIFSDRLPVGNVACPSSGNLDAALFLILELDDTRH